MLRTPRQRAAQRTKRRRRTKHLHLSICPSLLPSTRVSPIALLFRITLTSTFTLTPTRIHLDYKKSTAQSILYYLHDSDVYWLLYRPYSGWGTSVFLYDTPSPLSLCLHRISVLYRGQLR